MLLTSARMRAAEGRAIAAGTVTGAALMERAGQGIAAAILARAAREGRLPRRAVVLCGPGNNGGDGFVVARLLLAEGWAVEVFLHGEAARLPPDAALNLSRWQAAGAVQALPDGPVAAQDAVLVDALFGTGLARPLSPAARAALSGPAAFRVAVDVPSGLCADSGRVLGGEEPPPADLTVTFHRAKAGHYLADGPRLCGALLTVDLGLPPEEEGPQDLTLVGPPEGIGKGDRDHKYSHGHALVLGGPPGRGGAARLATRGALRIGAGLVTLATPSPALAENAARLDAVMLRPMEGPGALARLLADPRLYALCAGPGWGTGARQAGDLATLLAARRAVVLDADALTLLARDPALAAGLHQGCVLTPHQGEFARLFPGIAARLAAPALRGPAFSRADAAREAAARAGCTVLLKGHDTVIARPDGHAALHSASYADAAPWLATAGTGDVLAGMIAGLLARGFPPFRAACAAAWLHAAAARSFGPGLIAEDLADRLPDVLRGLLPPGA